MTSTQSARRWSDAHREVGWDVLRLYVGLALFMKGLRFLEDLPHTRELLAAADFPFPGLAEPVAVVHLMGGLLLAFGMWTRFAAAVQVPIVAGAALFVHRREGLLSDGQALPLAILLLVLVTLFALGGAGETSLDAVFASRRSATRRPREPSHV
jgi:putative oxidoreductase